jgi:multiple sugar transport system permease protein
MIKANIFSRNKSIVNKRSGGQFVAFLIACIIMTFVCLTYLLAFLWAAFAATKTHTQIIIEPFALHKEWLFSNYIDVFNKLTVRGINMVGMIGNSLWLVFAGATLSILGPTLMAYALTKFNFFGRKLLISINFVVMIVPIVGALPAQYRMYAALRLINSPMIVITHFGCFGANLLIIMSFFRNLSGEYREAAIIDGAGEYRILFTIISACNGVTPKM